MKMIKATAISLLFMIWTGVTNVSHARFISDRNLPAEQKKENIEKANLLDSQEVKGANRIKVLGAIRRLHERQAYDILARLLKNANPTANARILELLYEVQNPSHVVIIALIDQLEKYNSAIPYDDEDAAGIHMTKIRITNALSKWLELDLKDLNVDSPDSVSKFIVSAKAAQKEKRNKH